MKTIAIAVMAAWVAASVFAATDAERIETLEKKVAELSRKVGVEAPLSVREAYAWHRARLMGLEGAVRHYELKADQLAQLSENAKAVYREELAAHSNRLLTARAEFEKFKASVTPSDFAAFDQYDAARDEIAKARSVTWQVTSNADGVKTNISFGARLFNSEHKITMYRIAKMNLVNTERELERCSVKEADFAKLSAEARKTIQDKIGRLKSELKNRKEIFEKRKAELTKEELAKVEAEERQRAAEERLSDELRKIRSSSARRK